MDAHDAYVTGAQVAGADVFADVESFYAVRPWLFADVVFDGAALPVLGDEDGLRSDAL